MFRHSRIEKLMDVKFTEIYMRLMSFARDSGWPILCNDVEDCIQEAFLLLFERWDELKDHKNLPGWLYITSVHNLSNKLRVLKARSKTTVASLDDDNGAADRAAQWLADEESAQLAEWENRQEMLLKIKQCLSESEYQFLLLYYEKSVTAKQVAEQYDISEAAAWKRRQRLIEKIRKSLFNMLLSVILSGFIAPVTLFGEGGVGGVDETHKNSQEHGPAGAGQPGSPLSRRDARTILAFLHRLPADQFDERDLRLADICYKVIDPSFGQDEAVDVESALGEHRRRVGLLKAQRREQARSARRLSRRALVALVVAGCLVLAAGVCYALGWVPWRKTVRTDEERYYINLALNQEMTADPYTSFLPTGLDPEVDRVLQENDIFVPLPTWIPDGYGNPEIKVDDIGFATLITINFYDDDGKFIPFDIIKYNDDDDEFVIKSNGFIEKDDNYFEEYEKEGMVYTILSNVGWLEIVWYDQPYECHFGGYISADEVHRMIDSIYDRSD